MPTGEKGAKSKAESEEVNYGLSSSPRRERRPRRSATKSPLHGVILLCIAVGWKYLRPSRSQIFSERRGGVPYSTCAINRNLSKKIATAFRSGSFYLVQPARRRVAKTAGAAVVATISPQVTFVSTTRRTQRKFFAQ